MESKEVLEKDYQTVYKPIAKFLYSHPDFCFSFSFSGIQFQFLKKHRSELISILRELVDRRQIEILGGGYYDPVLPLLYSVDRNGQIDLLSTEIRMNTGKRPRGISLFGDCWDSSLVNNLQTCGIEYVLLDGCVVPQQKRKFLPLIMSDLGKSIEIFPYYDTFVPETNTKPELFVQNIIKTVEKIERKDTYIQLQPDRIVNININHEKMVELAESNWFDQLSEYLKNNPDCRIKTTTPTNYKKDQIITIPAFIPAGINDNIGKWIGRAYNEIDPSKVKNPYTVHDFMETYPKSHSLYNRILYVSMLVNQYKKDKIRKKSARDKLWQAQNGSGLLCTSKGAFSNSRYRQQCYKYLSEAEKILREGDEKTFIEGISCFDYTCDGLNEYVCRMKNYFSYITLKGGALQELDVFKSGVNYADNLSKVREYDNYSDEYERGLFIDHIFTPDQFKSYLKGESAGDGIFSRIQYSENKFTGSHREVQLFADAVFPHTKQHITLKKNYIINSNGMTVQYILKNDSNTKFKAKFLVESNIAHTNFDPENINYYTLDVIDGGKKTTVDTTQSSAKMNRIGQLKNVYMVRLSDNENGVAFDFEPNENANYCFNPLLFRRPGFTGDNLVPVSLTYVSTLFWDIDIEPGMETEKSINFTISSIKKQKK